MVPDIHTEVAGLSMRRIGMPELVGLLLILVGGAYLLRNLGWLRVEWGIIWPLIVIVVGVGFLIGATGSRGERRSSTSVPRDGTGELDLDVKLGAGAFRIAGGAAALVEVDSRYDDIRSRVDRAGVRRLVRLRQDWDWGWWRGWHGRAEWDVRVAPDVPTALDLAAGAGEFDVDLADLRIVGARLSIGAATLRLTLPRPTGEVRVDVTAGASSVTVGVPHGVEARVATSGGLLSLQGPNESPGYASARDRVTVTVSGGASSVRVVPS